MPKEPMLSRILKYHSHSKWAFRAASLSQRSNTRMRPGMRGSGHQS